MGILQVFLNSGEQLRCYESTFARRRSGVRIPSAPLRKDLQKAGNVKGSGATTGAHYTSFCTSALRQRLLHSSDRAVLMLGQDVAVSVECYRYGRVPQHLGNDLGVDVLEQQDGGCGVPELMKRCCTRMQDFALRPGPKLAGVACFAFRPDAGYVSSRIGSLRAGVLGHLEQGSGDEGAEDDAARAREESAVVTGVEGDDVGPGAGDARRVGGDGGERRQA